MRDCRRRMRCSTSLSPADTFSTYCQNYNRENTSRSWQSLEEDVGKRNWESRYIYILNICLCFLCNIQRTNTSSETIVVYVFAPIVGNLMRWETRFNKIAMWHATNVLYLNMESWFLPLTSEGPSMQGHYTAPGSGLRRWHHRMLLLIAAKETVV